MPKTRPSYPPEFRLEAVRLLQRGALSTEDRARLCELECANKVLQLGA